VTAVSINTVLACQAYILFYSRHIITHTVSSSSSSPTQVVPSSSSSLSIMTNQGKASIESSTAVAAVSTLQSSVNIDSSNISSYSSNISALNKSHSTTTTTTTMTSQLTSPIPTTISSVEGRDDGGLKPNSYCRIDDDNNVVVGMNVSPNHLNNSDIIIKNNNNNSKISDDSSDSSINDVDVGNAIIDSSSSMIKACRLAPRFSIYVTPFRYYIVVSHLLMCDYLQVYV